MIFDNSDIEDEKRSLRKSMGIFPSKEEWSGKFFLSRNL